MKRFVTFSVTFLILLVMFLYFSCFTGHEKLNTLINDITIDSSNQSTTCNSQVSSAEKHPILVGKWLDWKLIAKKLVNPDYTILVNRIRNSAESNPTVLDQNNYSGTDAKTNGIIAKSAALLFYLEKNYTYAQKTKEILLGMYKNYNISIDNWSSENVYTATAIIDSCLAYDLLLSTDYLTSDEKTNINEVLTSWIDAYYKYYVEQYTVIFVLGAINNHSLIHASCIGLAALLFRDTQYFEKWINYSATAVNYFVNLLIKDDGGFAEGYYYSEYSAMHYMPFFIAYNRWCNGQKKQFPEVCNVRPSNDCVSNKIVDVDDFLYRSNVIKCFEMQVKLRTPLTHNPPVEDALVYYWFGGYIGGIYNNRLQIWHWLNQKSSNVSSDSNGLYFSSGFGCDFSVDTLEYYNSYIEPLAPTFNNVFLPDSGIAIFRSGWNFNSHYLMLNGEHGLIRGWSHEHVDDYSFQIYGYGEYLAVDSGYVKWDQSYLVSNDYNHNLILINDNGPPKPSSYRPPSFTETFNSYLINWIENSNFSHVEVTGTYQEVNVTRKIMFIHNLYYVIEDTLKPISSSSTYKYDWLLHVNGGYDASGIFSMTNNGTLLTMPSGVRMEIYQTNTSAPISISQKANIHGWYYNRTPEHSTLVSTVNAGNCKFITIMAPLTSEQYISVIPIDLGYSQSVGYKIEFSNSGFRDLIISRNISGTNITANLNSYGFKDNINFSGDFLLLSVDKSTPTIENFHYADNDSYFTY